MNVLMNMESKKEDFKKLFYSDLTETEIKEVLGLNYKEYKELLLEVKKELGLPSSYRRKPKRYWKYNEDSYYILKRTDNDFEVVSYCPTKEIAEIKLNNMSKEDNVIYIIDKASDENLIELVKEEYLDKKQNWEMIIRKCKIPYHKFYYFLNKIKEENGKVDNAIGDKRFVYKYAPTQKFIIKKYINGKYVNFGYYDDERTAVKVRDYLEKINWDINKWESNKYSVVGELVNE